MAQATAFLFGKLPAHGDFVARGLSGAERSAWDDWASGAIETLRREQGEHFEDAHDATPPWRFIAGPSRFGDAWRVGALAPSIDSAGRRYLLVLGLQGWAAERAAVLGLAAAEALEQILYRAIADRLTADDVVAAIGSMAEGLDLTAGAAADTLAAHLSAAGVWWSDGLALAGAEPTGLALQAQTDTPKRETAP